MPDLDHLFDSVTWKPNLASEWLGVEFITDENLIKRFQRLSFYNYNTADYDQARVHWLGRS